MRGCAQTAGRDNFFFEDPNQKEPMKNNRKLRAALMVAGVFLFSAALSLNAASPFFTNGPLSVAREFHTATLLQNGKILIAGGYNGNSIASSELYDPATGTSATNGALAN